MWCRVAYPHRQFVKAVSRGTAGDQVAHCQAAAVYKFIFNTLQKADICLGLPFRLQCAGPPFPIPHRKFFFDSQHSQGGDLR